MEIHLERTLWRSACSRPSTSIRAAAGKKSYKLGKTRSNGEFLGSMSG